MTTKRLSMAMFRMLSELIVCSKKKHEFTKEENEFLTLAAQKLSLNRTEIEICFSEMHNIFANMKTIYADTYDLPLVKYDFLELLYDFLHYKGKVANKDEILFFNEMVKTVSYSYGRVPGALKCISKWKDMPLVDYDDCSKSFFETSRKRIAKEI